MWVLIGLALLCDYDPMPKITEKELIESRCNVELDGKELIFFAKYINLNLFTTGLDIMQKLFY